MIVHVKTASHLTGSFLLT